MSTTVSGRRSAAEWDELARSEILPMLQGGAKMGEVATKFNNGNTNAIRAALGRIGFDTKGQPLVNKPITVQQPAALARAVAARREANDPWWKIEAATGKSTAELRQLLAEQGFGHLADGRVAQANGE